MLERLKSLPSTAQNIVQRAKIILLTDLGEKKIGKKVGCSEKTVSKWRSRWREFVCELNGSPTPAAILEALSDAPRSGAPIHFGPEQCARLVAMSCQKPTDFDRAGEVWSRRELKDQAIESEIVKSISERQIGRIIEEAQIQPNKNRYWLYPKEDEYREQTIVDVCDVYRQAAKRFELGEITLSIDEMTAIQAKERIAPDHAPEPGKGKPKSRWRIEHEYVRHGTLCLLGAWDVAQGKAFGWCNPTRKEGDFVEFIKKCQAQFPESKRIHIVLDNLNTHQSESLVLWVAQQVGTSAEDLGVKGESGILKSMKTRAEYLARAGHPIVFHYTPRHCSWMNQIEIWFSILMRKLLKTASFKSTAELETRIMDFIAYFNRTMAMPFKWMFQGFDSEN